jgi:glutathione S-transferase
LRLTGDVKLTQTNAILRHISRKNGLDGKTEAEKDRVDLLENEAMDFRNGFVMFSYNFSRNPDFVSGDNLAITIHDCSMYFGDYIIDPYIYN